MLSSGVRNLGRLVGGWSLAVAACLLVMVHFDEIRTTLGLKLEPEDFGIRTEADEGGTPSRLAAVAHERTRGEPGDMPLSGRSARLMRSRDGHFHADASINGRTIPVLVDTGATLVALSYEDAQSAGIHVGASDFRYVSQTANGEARFARVTLDSVRVGDITVHNVPAAVGQPGRLSTTLLGMSFLGTLRMEMKGATLTLEQ